MKTTKYYKIMVGFILLFLSPHAFSQNWYQGGDGDGSASEKIELNSCTNPYHFYAYFGGNGDGSSVEANESSICETPYHFYAYFGGTKDGAATETLENNICNTPYHFYAYFGGVGDGSVMDMNPLCAVVLPIADFTATPTSICVGQNVTFTDASSNALDWTWTFTGGTLVSPSTIHSQNPVVKYNTGGTYPVTLVVRNMDGTNSITRTSYITVNTSASVTATTPGSRCGAGSVTIGATPSSGTINWYTASTGGTSIGSGTTFNTPSIGTTTTFYAEAFNGCTSSTRTAVIATINATPTITSTTPASVCDSGTITLQAATSAGTISWFDVATGGTALGTGTSFTTPILTTTTTYYVESNNGTCPSPRTAVIANVNTTPTVSSTTPASRCGTGSVTLQAVASAGTLNWYTAATGGTYLGTGTIYTTPSISLTTTYYVSATDNSCTSTRTAVVATINATPTITSTTPASNCGAGSLTLQATASVGTISWFDVATGGTALATGTSFTTPSLSTTTTYYVESTNGTCTSTRTAVVATINAIPTITSTTPANRCGSGSVTLQATASTGTISWYDASTGGTALATGTSYTTPSLSTTTTYYVEVSNGSCTPSTRTAVIATINPIPTITSTTPASNCGTGSVTLQASASDGTISWFAVSTGGTALGTGTSFTTPSLSTTTTYYVETNDGTCSSTRTTVVATINAIPTITSTTPASNCGTGSVTLQATASVGTISWFDVATGGTAIGTGTSFTTPSLSTTTTYYVEVSNGTCTSTRTAIEATINANPTVTSTTPASRCGDGQVTLQANSDFGTINWYSAATGGTLLSTGTSYTTPILGGTTIYYVEAINGLCISSRIPVTATLYAMPAITSTTPASRCDYGTLTLQATASTGTLSWFATASGGTALATGTSFTTPSLSTSTTYYVEATNGDCTTSRVAVIASINPTASPTGTSNQTFCSGETVSLITVNGSNIIWYDSPSGGNIVSNSTPIVDNTTYYASQTISGCESPTRLAVTMTLGNCLGNEIFDFSNLKVYPNPVLDIVKISHTQTIDKVELFNMIGQVIYSKSINATDTEIDMSLLATATYFLKVQSNNQIKIIKVIKK